MLFPERQIRKTYYIQLINFIEVFLARMKPVDAIESLPPYFGPLCASLGIPDNDISRELIVGYFNNGIIHSRGNRHFPGHTRGAVE